MKTYKGLRNCTKFECRTRHNTTVPEILQEYLWELIIDRYGSPLELAKYLDLAVEMLFYIEEDTFDRKEIQDVVSAIRGIIDALRKRE